MRTCCEIWVCINSGRKRQGGFIAEVTITHLPSGSTHVLTTQSGTNYPVITSTDGNTGLVFTPIPSAGVADKFLLKPRRSCLTNTEKPEWLWNGNYGNDMTFQLEIPNGVLQKYCGIRTQEIVSAKTGASVSIDHVTDEITKDYRDNVIIGLIVLNVITIIGAYVIHKNLSNKNEKLQGYRATETDPLLI